MTAKKMFIDLGYLVNEDNDYYRVYVKRFDSGVIYEVAFIKDNKCVEMSASFNREPHYFVRLDKELIRAIDQQVKEFKW